METKTRRNRFEEVAGKRVQMILDKLDNLSNCANKRNYEYDQKDVDKMFHAINAAVRKTKDLFNSEINTSDGEKKIFKF